MLNGIIYSLARPEHLVLGLSKLGQNHHRYGVKDEYYHIIKEAMLETIPEVLGDKGSARINAAWDQALDFVISSMQKWKEGVLLEE